MFKSPEHHSIFVYKKKQQGLMPAIPGLSLKQDGFLYPLRAARGRNAQNGQDEHSSPLQQGSAQKSTNSSLDIAFRVCLKSFPAPLEACPVHFLTWFWFPQTVPRSGTEGHLFASFTRSLLRSRLLLKAHLRHQSCARAGERQAGECQRANRQMLPADSTSPILKLPLIKNIANQGSKRNKNPKK